MDAYFKQSPICLHVENCYVCVFFISDVWKELRSRSLVLLLLPVIVFIWLVGWSLRWIGSQKESCRAKVVDDSIVSCSVDLMLARSIR